MIQLTETELHTLWLESAKCAKWTEFLYKMELKGYIVKEALPVVPISKFCNLRVKEDAKELENSTKRIINIVPKVFSQLYFEATITLQSWYKEYGIPAGNTKKKWEKLTQLIGEPVYYVNHVNRNALWLLVWKGHRVLLYCDKGGLDLQVEDSFPPNRVNILIKDLIKHLHNRL